MNKLVLCLLGAVLALAASCTSPLATLAGNKPQAAVLGAHDAQLVFQASVSENRAITGDTYLTVQLKSAADGTVKFASATGANGTYTVTVGGMVAGDWNLKVMLYDSQASQVLKYYGNKTQYIAVGSSNTVAVPLYTPGTVNGVTFTDALLTNHVTIMDPNGVTVLASPQPVVIGTAWDLDAQAFNSTDDTVVATQPGVLWTSSDENVATVTANGRVFVQKKGTATITALSAENHLKTATYDVAGVPAVFGTWNLVNTSNSPPNSNYKSWVVWEFAADTFVQYRWDNEGDVEYVKGDYAYEQGILKFANVQAFDSSTKTWTSPPPGELAPEDLAMLVSVTKETMTMGRIQSLVLPYGPYASSLGRANVSIAQLYMRVPMVPLAGITLNGVASGGTLSLPMNIPLTALYEQVNTPIDATISGLYWTSSQPTVVGYTPDGRFVALANSGSALVTGYALNDLATPVVSYTVNAAANEAPQLTMTSPALITSPAATLDFVITDEQEITNYNWTITLAGTTKDSGSATTVNAKSATLSRPLSPSAYISYTDGDYTLSVTAWDRQGNTATRTTTFTIQRGPVASGLTMNALFANNTVTITDPDGVAATVYVYSMSPAFSIVSPSFNQATGVCTFSLSTTTLSPGTYSIQVDAADSSVFGIWHTTTLSFTVP